MWPEMCRQVEYADTDEQANGRFARMAPLPVVGVGPTGLEAARHRHGVGGDRGSGQPVAEEGAGRRPRILAPPHRPGSAPSPHRAAARPAPRSPGQGRRSLRVPRRRLDRPADHGPDPAGVWRPLSPFSRQSPRAPRGPERPTARGPRRPARPGPGRRLAHRALADPRKKARDEGRTIIWVDESGFFLLPARVRTYAPKGQTPLLTVPLTHDHLSAIGGLNGEGRLLLHVQTRAFKGPDVVRFLKHLLRHVPGKLLVIWDGAPIHRCQAVKAFLAAGAAARLHLEPLPRYAPDVNPD